MNDQLIRYHLLNKLHQEYPNTDTDRNLVVNEMAVCRGVARIDVAVINGSLHGFEIKSSEDNLNRLDNQLNTYLTCFDYVSVVTTQKHLKKVREMCPQTIGISEAVLTDGSLKIVVRRKAKKNKQIDSLSLLQLLWKEEAIQLADLAGLGLKLAHRPKHYIWGKIIEHVDTPQLQDLVRVILKSREGWRSASLPE